MAIVVPLQDEMTLPHLLRHQRIEGYASTHHQFRALRVQFGGGNGFVEKLPTVHLLARACEMDPAEYVRRHTMVPIMRPVAEAGSRTVSTPQAWQSSAFSHGFEVPIDEGRICMECVEIDRAHSRLSPFRRIHHVRGINRCPLHGLLLHIVQDQDPFSELPWFWIDQGRIGLAPEIEDLVSDQQWMSRYRQICLAMLNATGPLRAEDVNRSLRSRADELGLAISFREAGLLFSDALLQKAGRKWLAKNLPRLSEKKPGVVFAPMDSLRDDTHAVRTSTLYAAMWAFFETDPWTEAQSIATLPMAEQSVSTDRALAVGEAR